VLPSLVPDGSCFRFLAARGPEVKAKIAVRCGAVVKKRRLRRAAVGCHLDSTATAKEGRTSWL
jgi:hypothetical protein